METYLLSYLAIGAVIGASFFLVSSVRETPLVWQVRFARESVAYALAILIASVRS